MVKQMFGQEVPDAQMNQILGMMNPELLKASQNMMKSMADMGAAMSNMNMQAPAQPPQQQAPNQIGNQPGQQPPQPPPGPSGGDFNC